MPRGAAFDSRTAPSASALSGAGEEPDGGRRKTAGERRPAALMQCGVTPSPSNMRALIRLGLIGTRQNWQGSGNRQEPQSFPPETPDRVRQTQGTPGSQLQVGMRGIQRAGERKLFRLFQSLSTEKRKMALEIMHLVIAISGPGS